MQANEQTKKRISEWPNTSQFLVILNHSATVGGTGPIWRCLDGEKDLVVVVVVAIADVVVDVVVVVVVVVVVKTQTADRRPMTVLRRVV